VPQGREAEALGLVSIADGAIAEQAATHGACMIVDRRLVVAHAGGDEDRLRLQALGADDGGEITIGIAR
jgi:hypothetical protein